MRKSPESIRVGLSRLVVVILVSLALVAALIGGFVVLSESIFRENAQEVISAESAADAFFGKLRSGQVEEAYRSTTEDFQRFRSSKEFADYVAANPVLTTQTSHTIFHSGFEVRGSQKITTIVYDLAGPKVASKCTVVLLEEDRGWKVHRVTVP